jgi:GTP pyrophosphokinase
MENLLIKFANCCKPLPGDRIVGFVSRGRGIIIHKESCPNIKNIQDFDQRKIEIEWDTKSSRTVRRFRVMAKKSVDLFSQIESAVRKLNGRLLEGRLEEDDQNRLIGTFTMELDHEDDAAKVIKSIRSIPMVSVIQRID